jgi:carbonic anhydrase
MQRTVLCHSFARPLRQIGLFALLTCQLAYANPPTGDISATTASNPKEVGNQLREALGTSIAPNKNLTLVVGGKPVRASEHANKSPATIRAGTPATRQLGQPFPSGSSNGSPPTPAVTGQRTNVAPPVPAPPPEPPKVIHWAYEGEGAPANWGKIKPEFSLCALGKRQSPIHIADGSTLVGPAEQIQFNYTPSNASVVNNGHTVQVDVQGENSIVIRGTVYRLVQFHFHTPSEEQINFQRYPMGAHLVHRSDEGQLAVVALLMDIGNAHPFIDKVWTYMPLEVKDRVRMPREMLNLNEILPADQSYYQFIGSLTTPPCTEGVLWVVMKQPIQISKNQHKLFTQLYPMNARPVQALNDRIVREAQSTR